jgi:hypothetical protein
MAEKNLSLSQFADDLFRSVTLLDPISLFSRSLFYSYYKLDQFLEAGQFEEG